MINNQSNEVTKKLQRLGLTEIESKAYVAVAKLGWCKPLEIAREAQLQRTEIYRLMKSLVSKTLVEEAIERPKRYRAVDFRDAIDYLTQNMLARMKQSKLESKQLIRQLESLQLARQSTQTPALPRIILITGLEEARRNIREQLATARKEVRLISSAKRLSQVSPAFLSYFMDIAKRNNLKAKAIFEVNDSNAKMMKKLAPILEIRHFPNIPGHAYSIDNHVAIMGLVPPEGGGSDESLELLVSYGPWVSTLKMFFDAIWNQATPLRVKLASLTDERLGETRIIWGREEMFAQTSDWYARAERQILEFATPMGPARLVARFKEGHIEARKRGVRIRALCDVTDRNVAYVRELCKIAEVRHTPSQFGIGIAILDDSEALIHHIHPDSADLTSSSFDVSVYTTNRRVVRDLSEMFEFLWRRSPPAEKILSKIKRKA